MVEVDQGLVIALADGAGGTSHGANAAQRIVDVIANERSLPTMERCAQWIEELDGELAGQGTAVILAVGRHITGASVGDSGAWLIGAEVIDLTHAQHRKPLVGDGCTAVMIEPVLFEGTLLVASDGLFRYATQAAIVDNLDRLVDLVRLPNGALQDDLSFVIASPTSSGAARSTTARR